MNASMLQVTSAQIRLLALVAAAGERGSAMHFLEFFARVPRRPPQCYKRLTKPVLDHPSDTLGVRHRQHMTPLALDDFEHFRIAHAAETFDEILFVDGITAVGSGPGTGLVDDWLTVATLRRSRN